MHRTYKGVCDVPYLLECSRCTLLIRVFFALYLTYKGCLRCTLRIRVFAMHLTIRVFARCTLLIRVFAMYLTYKGVFDVPQVIRVFAMYQLWLDRKELGKKIHLKYTSSTETVERHNPTQNPTHENSAKKTVGVYTRALIPSSEVILSTSNRGGQ